MTDHSRRVNERFQSAWLAAQKVEVEASILLGLATGESVSEALEFREMAVELELLAFRVMVRGRSLADRATADETETAERRCFNAREKQILFGAAGGLCQRCGESLGERWHADHRHPYSKGGATHLSNGAALCGPCNIRKGAKILG